MKAEDILFSVPFPVAITDGTGKVVTVNQKFESFLNRSLKYLKGKKLSAFFGNPEKVDENISRAFNNLVEILGFKDGEYFLSFAPLFVSSKVAGVVVVVHPAGWHSFGWEITFMLKGLFHEIRNPLGGIKGAVKLLQSMRSYDEELVEVVLEEAERIERLLDDVARGFDFTALSLKPVNIHRIVQSVVKLFEGELREKGIEVIYDFDPSLPDVLLDSDRITQAFMNLFRNAIEAVEKSSVKLVRLETGYAIHPSGFFFVRIKDTGVGMSEEDLKNLFVPFYTTKETGTGLGAFIAAEIVKMHGGEIKVRSGKGDGTEVTLLLPMKVRDGEDSRCG